MDRGGIPRVRLQGPELEQWWEGAPYAILPAWLRAGTKTASTALGGTSRRTEEVKITLSFQHEYQLGWELLVSFIEHILDMFCFGT